jgi:hypothetical protein
VLDENGQLLANSGPFSVYNFTFDHVYDQYATQQSVYEVTARGAVYATH